MAEKQSIRYGHNEPLEVWLAKARPSQLSSDRLNWIWVDSPFQRPYPQFNFEEMQQQFAAHLSKNPTASATELAAFLRQLAVQHGCVCGKWLIFPKQHQVDEAWAKVAKSVVLGRLGHVAKVDPTSPQKGAHVICVYNEDFTNMFQVNAIRQVLRELGFTWQLQYKPDVYTYLGIYGNNQWKIDPAVYRQ